MTATKKTAQFPKTPLSNRPLSKVQVLQYMISSKPWSSFNLSVTCFSQDARSWWDLARKLGPTIRTDAALRKWGKQAESGQRPSIDEWGVERGSVLDRVVVKLRIHGVDGSRLSRCDDVDDIIDPLIPTDGVCLFKRYSLMTAHLAAADFADVHIAKWATLADEAHVCQLCFDKVNTEVLSCAL